MADLVRHGLVRPASVAPHTRLPRRKPLAPLDAVLLDLEAARSER
jgi:hypothetical protein